MPQHTRNTYPQDRQRQPTTRHCLSGAGLPMLSRCPPLGGIAITTLAIAVLPAERLAVTSLMALWQDRAALALEEHVPAAPLEKDIR